MYVINRSNWQLKKKRKSAQKQTHSAFGAVKQESEKNRKYFGLIERDGEEISIIYLKTEYLSSSQSVNFFKYEI